MQPFLWKFVEICASTSKDHRDGPTDLRPLGWPLRNFETMPWALTNHQQLPDSSNFFGSKITQDLDKCKPRNSVLQPSLLVLALQLLSPCDWKKCEGWQLKSCKPRMMQLIFPMRSDEWRLKLNPSKLSQYSFFRSLNMWEVEGTGCKSRS